MTNKEENDMDDKNDDMNRSNLMLSASGASGECENLSFDDEYNDQYYRTIMFNTTTSTADQTNDSLGFNTVHVPLDYDIGVGVAKETKILCCPLCQRTKDLCCYSIFCRFKNTHSNNNDGVQEDKPSNEELLSLAFITFLIFTICQAFAAFIAKSEAMLGDTAAMAVDAFTYGFNFIAERMKNKLDQGLIQLKHRRQQQSQLQRQQERNLRKSKLYLEIIPPLVTVATLISITIVILNKSIGILTHRDIEDQNYPNVVLMFIFSSLNLVVDIVNVCFFASANHAFGYETVDDDDDDDDDDDGNHSSIDCVNGESNIMAGHHHHHRHHHIITNIDDDDDASINGIEMKPQLNKKKQMSKITKQFKNIHRERRRKKGGAYSHLPGDSIIVDEEYNEDNNDFIHENDNTSRGKDDKISSSKEEYELTKFTIDDDDNDDNFDNDENHSDDDNHAIKNNNNIERGQNGTRTDNNTHQWNGNESDNYHGHIHEGRNLNMVRIVCNQAKKNIRVKKLCHDFSHNYYLFFIICFYYT